MLAAISPNGVRTPVRSTRARGRYPARTLHLIDVENLAGAGLPDRWQVGDVRAWYERTVGLGPADHVVIACNHLALVNVALGWPGVRYRIRSGPDGADLELLDVLCHENVSARFSRFVIASGDGIFAAETARLAAAGCQVTVVSHRGRLSARLRLAACEVVWMGDQEQALAANYPDPEAA